MTPESFGRLSTELLARSRDLPVEQFPALLREVVVIIGANDAEVSLIDYSQRYLCSIERGATATGDQVVEGTLAGRCFLAQEILSHVDDDGRTSTWVPLVDGSDRVGVLRLIWDDGVSPDHDGAAGLDELSTLVTEILVSRNQYSDWFRQRRRRHDLTLAADMQWRQLPPITYSTEDFAIAGILEPAYNIGGDSFDYAQNDSILSFSVSDAMGHGLGGVFLSLTVSSSLRHSRSHSHPLPTAYRDADELLRQRYDDHSYVTAILGELDVDRGRLRWINAGHPLPLLVRDRTVVGELQCRPSLPLGLGGDVVEIGEHDLQAGDRLVFYTDGITEAHAPGATQFGLDRLADLVLTATLDGLPVAETVRRLSHSVSAHHSELFDDATILVLEWSRVGDDRS